MKTITITTTVTVTGSSRLVADTLATMTPSQTRELAVLEFLYDAPDHSLDTQTTLAPLEAQHAPDELERAAAALRERGEVDYVDVLAGFDGACLTPHGVARVEEVRVARADPAARSRAAREAMLRWMYDLDLRGDHAADITAFIGCAYDEFYGKPFTRREAQSALDRLCEQGYATGFRGHQGNAVIRPRITAAGKGYVENGPGTGGPVVIRNEQHIVGSFQAPVASARPDRWTRGRKAWAVVVGVATVLGGVAAVVALFL